MIERTLLTLAAAFLAGGCEGCKPMARVSADRPGPTARLPAAPRGEPPGKAGPARAFRGGDMRADRAFRRGSRGRQLTFSGRVTYLKAAPPPPIAASPLPPLEDRTVLVGLSARGGWAALIWANRGFAPGRRWTTSTGQTFRVRLVPRRDQPVAASTSSRYHMAASNLDRLALEVERLKRHPGAWPRAQLLLGYGRGGVGLVVRGGVRSVNQLGGKRVVLQQNSSSHYLLLNALAHADVPLSSPRLFFAATPRHAAAAFHADRSLDACVARTPDILFLKRQAGSKLLFSTRTASRLLAGVLHARADFAAAHADLVAGIVRGTLAAAEELRPAGAPLDEASARIRTLTGLMSAGFGVPEDEARGMLVNDAHLCTLAENRGFFLDASHPAGFRVLWDDAVTLYRRSGQITHAAPHAKVLDVRGLRQEVARRRAPSTP